jgi:hypothetical protein
VRRVEGEVLDLRHRVDAPLGELRRLLGVDALAARDEPRVRRGRLVRLFLRRFFRGRRLPDEAHLGRLEALLGGVVQAAHRLLGALDQGPPRHVPEGPRQRRPRRPRRASEDACPSRGATQQHHDYQGCAHLEA